MNDDELREALRQLCKAPGNAFPPDSCGCVTCWAAKRLAALAATADAPPEDEDGVSEARATKDVLAILLLNTWHRDPDEQAKTLAPIIEKGLWAAYGKGASDTALGAEMLNNRGVTPAIAAMMEGL